MRCLQIVFVVATLFLLSCKSTSTTNQATNTSDSESAKAAIIALNQQWETRFKNRDATGLANLFTDDCVRMPDGAVTSTGRQALEIAYRQEFAELWKTEFTAAIATDEVVVSGDYGFARGTDTLRQEIAGKTVTESGKWMATYRREPDGSWKYYWSTYNSNH